ncbi:MAG: hypothetical protein AVDCRST_MAG19-3690, partial [uncultured Thermomicrobiales bacterium]
ADGETGTNPARRARAHPRPSARSSTRPPPGAARPDDGPPALL